MKKITYCIALLFAVAFHSYGQDICIPATAINENFDSTPNNSLPPCWSSIIYSEAEHPYASVVARSDSPHTSPKSIEFSRGDNADTQLTLVLPQTLNLADGTHRLKFYAKSVYGVVTVEVGTLNNTTTDATFTPVGDAIQVTDSYTEFTVDFSNLGEITDTYIGIRATEYAEDFTYMYVDDVRWELTPACPDVTLVSVDTVTDVSATVSWTPAADETAWDVAYALASVTDTTGLTVAATAQDTPTAVINGLSANTAYKVWVRSVCEGGLGDWIGPVAFTSACSAITDFNENFEGVENPHLPECWSSIIRGDGVTYARVNTDLNYPHSGTKDVELYNGFQTGLNKDVILVSPRLSNLGDTTHRLKFFARGSGTLGIGTLTSNTITGAFSYYSDPIVLTSTMTEYTVDFSNYTESDPFIGLRIDAPDDSYIYVDDIRWEVNPSCPDVTNIVFSEFEPTTVYAEWDAPSPSQWQVAYGPVSVTDPGTLTPSALLDFKNFSFTNLEENTSYNVWVRSVCGGPDGFGAWIGPMAFKTACSAVSDFTEGFESAVGSSIVDCWTAITNPNTIATVSTIQYQPYAGANVIEFGGVGAGVYLVSPKLTNVSLGGHRLKFYARNSTGNGLEVGTMSSNQPGATFTPVQAITLDNNYTQYIVDFSEYETTDKYIAFQYVGSQLDGVNLDNVIWEAAPLCADVVNVTVPSVTVATADVTWEAGGTETGWQVAYAQSSISDPTGLTPSETYTSTNTQLTGLAASTIYNVWVRSVCGTPNGNGAWIGPVTFTTACAATNVPYTQNFQSVIVPALPNCSSTDTADGAANWKTQSNSGSGFSGKALVFEGDGVTTGNAWFFTQGINLSANVSYGITYKYGNNSEGLHESLKVAYGTSDNAAAMVTVLADHPDVTGGIPQNGIVTFTPEVAGVYYFGFNAYSAPGQWQLLVDNIVVDMILSNGDFEKDGFAYYPNPVKNTLNLSYKQNISEVSIFNLLGQKVLTKTIGAANAQVDMSSLSAGSYIVKVTADNQTKTIKVIKE